MEYENFSLTSGGAGKTISHFSPSAPTLPQVWNKMSYRKIVVSAGHRVGTEIDGRKDMERMTFTTDRTTVTEGEIVEVRWDCPGAESVDLTIDNGYKTSVIPLEIGGSKRFRLNRSKGRTRLVLTAHVGGKGFSKAIKVKVKEIPVTRAETVDQRGNPMGWLKRMWNMPKWQAFLARYRQGRQAMPKEKKLASNLLMILGAILLLGTIFPILLPVGIFALACYLMWIVLKR